MSNKQKIRKLGNYLLDAQANLTKRRIEMEGIAQIRYSISQAIILLEELEEDD